MPTSVVTSVESGSFALGCPPHMLRANRVGETRQKGHGEGALLSAQFTHASTDRVSRDRFLHDLSRDFGHF